MRYFMPMEEAAEKVRFGEEDKPNKYGMTKKMQAICDLADNNKSLEEANWEVTPDDKRYYEDSKFLADCYREEHGGRNPNWVYYTVDID